MSAMTIHVQVYWTCIFIFLGKYLGMAGSHSMCLAFYKTVKLFSTVAVPFNIPSAIYENSSSLYPDIVSLLM